MSAAKLKIKKGDKVTVLTGKDKGKTGEVLKVLPQENRVVVKGINLATKHKKPTQFAQGGIEKIEAPIHASNVALIDPKDGKATRVGYKTLKDGQKARVAKRSSEVLG